MMQQKLVITVFTLTIGFLGSCSETGSIEKPNLPTTGVKVKDSGSVAGIEEIQGSTQTNTVSTVPEKIHSISQLNKRLNKKPSFFVIKANRDTVLKCKEGTLVSIPADAFLSGSNNGSVVGEVKIAVREFYKVSDMLIAGLTTTSNNRLLETGGMINIKVTNKTNNDSCVLKPGKSITIALASSEIADVDRMQLFNGTHDSTQVNWEPRIGLAGVAQRWGFRRANFPYIQTYSNFVFPEGIIKSRPALINSIAEELQVEIKVALRDLNLYIGSDTKRANGYIDTSGSLHCYKVSGVPQNTSFAKLYSPTIYQDIKVNLAVDVNLSYRVKLNPEYYQKLFRMGKGNPDSLVTMTVTLNPALKLTAFEKIKNVYQDAVTVKEFKKNKKQEALIMQEYKNRLKQLRLEDEEKLTKMQSTGTADLRSAQDYLLLSTPKLGWINCDRFYNNPVKVDYFVKLDENASLLIVFKNLRSIMSSDKNGVFAKVPLNEKITLVGLKTEKGKLMMALHETAVTEQPFEKLRFEPVTVKEYKSRLEKLNRL